MELERSTPRRLCKGVICTFHRFLNFYCLHRYTTERSTPRITAARKPQREGRCRLLLQPCIALLGAPVPAKPRILHIKPIQPVRDATALANRRKSTPQDGGCMGAQRAIVDSRFLIELCSIKDVQTIRISWAPRYPVRAFSAASGASEFEEGIPLCVRLVASVIREAA